MSQPYLIGRTLAERYEILELVGQGGMSAVYKAKDRRLERVVAVKLIHPHLSNNPDFVRRFNEEATTVADLHHPNIIQVYDFNNEGDAFFIVFEFIPGESLQAYLKRLNESKRLMPYEKTVDIAAKIADALSYAHGRGVIHRDIKPANVMLSVDDRAVLMDFGIVKIVGGDTHTATGAVLGTATYMSPEQIRSEQVDARSDIYSFGVMLYEMVGSRPPFQADSALSMMMMHVNDPVPDLWAFRSDVPSDLYVIIRKALAKDRAQRFQTAGEIVTALREATLEPPADKGTMVIPPAFAVTSDRQQADASAGRARDDAKTATQAAGNDRRKVLTYGGIALAVLLVICIAAGAFAFASGLLTGDDNGVTPVTGTAVADVVETDQVIGTEAPTVVVTPVTPSTETAVPTLTATVEIESTVEPTPATLRYEGVELNILTVDGPHIAEPLQRRSPEFESLTGAKANIIAVSVGELFQKIATNSDAEMNGYDAWVVNRQMMVDLVAQGRVEELTGEVAGDEAIEWDDVAPFFRNYLASYDGRIYGIPLDGDIHIGYFRSDLLDEADLDPPKTWDQYLETAAVFHGQDLNDDGDPDYGSCIPVGIRYVLSIASSMLQSQGTSQGLFFDLETMEPLVDNEGFRRALDIFSEARLYGPPDEVNTGGFEVVNLFTSGRCALSVFYGDLGARAISPWPSVVMDNLGGMILPGSTEVLDRDSGTLVDCNEDTCPYAVDGINHAPFAGQTGWLGAINAASNDLKKAAAYDFLSYMSQPQQSNEDVTIGASGFNPYRISQFHNHQPWVEGGMDQSSAGSYLGAIEESVSNPNTALDLDIPQGRRYQIVLFSALTRYWSGDISQDEAIQQVYDGWEQITEELGREDQLAAYRSSLGLARADG